MIPQNEIEAGAQILRERQMAGRITLEWSALTASSKKKWLAHSEAVLWAAKTVRIDAQGASA